MLTCHDIARYFLSLTDEDSGDLISNLKLQKLVYYAQGFHLAKYESPLFSEDIYAWTHGPVVPSLYNEYKRYGSGPIPCPTDLNYELYNSETRAFLDEVYSVYGQFSAWKLRNMTHEESPWKEVAESSGVIRRDTMQEYFKTLLVAD